MIIMSEAEFLGMLIIALGALGVIITPIIRLNGSITELNAALKFIQQNNATRDARLNSHSAKLDAHEIKLTDHEVRLKNLED